MKLLTDSFLVFYFNESTAAFIQKWAEELNVEFLFQRKAKLRLGSFKAQNQHSVAQIFIQKDLPPGQSLIVLCHELAHAFVYRQKVRKARPHGVEWQFAYRMMLTVALELYSFDSEWQAEVLSQIEKPRATTHHRENTDQQPDHVHVKLLTDGTLFRYRNKEFRRVELRRTRVMCERIHDRKQYLFQGTVSVLPLNTNAIKSE